MSNLLQTLLCQFAMTNSFPVRARCLADSSPRAYGPRTFPPEYLKGEQIEIHGIAVSDGSFELLVSPEGVSKDQSDYVGYSDLPPIDLVDKSFAGMQIVAKL